MFSALKQGSPFYILNKNKDFNLNIGQVESVTAPKTKFPTYQVGQPFGNPNDLVVDIKVKTTNDGVLEFKQVPASAVIADFNNSGLVISESREAMLSEIENTIQMSQTILDNVPYHQTVVKNGDNMRKTLNPTYAKEKDRDYAIDNMRSELNELKKGFTSIQGDISKIAAALNKA